MATKMTDEEHIARAMLLGMSYYHGNGEPFYYRTDEGGSISVVSMIDANTLEPLVDTTRDPLDWQGMARTARARKLIR